MTTVQSQKEREQPRAGGGIRVDKELEQYRNLMEVPGTFVDGFSWTALVGAIFVAMLMVPGAMYMGLLAGSGVGPAAQWVTVILFIEVARRAHKRLNTPELFVLFYMAGAAMSSPFSGLHWNQFFAQSQAAVGMGIADQLPMWYAPHDPDVLVQRNFFHPAWYPALGMFIFQNIVGRLDSSILSYGLFRMASDVEKLPFPLAPIGVQGILALAEQQSEEGSGAKKVEGQPENWRWRVFSIGGVLGLSFGALYMALPAISGAFFSEPIVIFPIPFVDFTTKTSDFLPAFATGLTLDLGQFILGMVLPFFAMLGSFIGLLITAVANPVLYHFGVLNNWRPGQETVMTLFTNQIDFYFSFSIGVAIAVAIAGIYQVVLGMRARKKATPRMEREGKAAGIVEKNPYAVPPGRGDIRPRYMIGLYLLSTTCYIVLSCLMIEKEQRLKVLWILLFFAYLYTPMLSYVTARLEGMVGQVVTIPFIREAAFILSGYRGVTIWFVPVPIADYGGRTVFWRQCELTGTSFWSIWKTELVLFPIIMVSSILFAQFIWSLAPIPGPQYPFTERMWELSAANQSIMLSSTLGRFSMFERAFRADYLAAGAGFGVVLFFIMWTLQLPIMLIFGVIRGLNQTLPHSVVLQFTGALIGRFYFERKMGLIWRKYIFVVSAGFACGMGLVTVLGVGFNFLAKAVIKIQF